MSITLKDLTNEITLKTGIKVDFRKNYLDFYNYSILLSACEILDLCDVFEYALRQLDFKSLRELLYELLYLHSFYSLSSEKRYDMLVSYLESEV